MGNYTFIGTMVQVKQDVPAIESSELPHVKDVPCFFVMIYFASFHAIHNTIYFFTASYIYIIYAFNNA